MLREPLTRVTDNCRPMLADSEAVAKEHNTEALASSNASRHASALDLSIPAVTLKDRQARLIETDKKLDGLSAVSGV
jgi:hypothetical protein